MPPSIWPAAVAGLIAMPQSTTITSFSTVTWPVSVSTSTSANWAAKGGGLTGLDMCDAVAMIWCWSVCVQAVQRDLGQRDAAAVGGATPAVAPASARSARRMPSITRRRA